MTLKQVERRLTDNINKHPVWYNTKLSWTKFRANARKIKKLDFGCNFDAEGKCSATRDSAPGWCNTQRACCSGCADAVGYLYAVQPGTVPYYLHCYNPDTGFWREGKGCILPHSRRSKTCLTYSCQSASEHRYEVHGANAINNQAVDKILFQIKPLTVK